MSAAVNSITGAQPGSAGSWARGLEPASGYESGGPESQVPAEVRPVFGSTADEYAARGAGSTPPSLGNATCSGFSSGATTGGCPEHCPTAGLGRSRRDCLARLAQG